MEWEWLVSVGKDKALVWEDSETGRRLGSFTVAGWATALAFDAGAKYAFVGKPFCTQHRTSRKRSWSRLWATAVH